MTQVYAHRGARTVAPENTLPAFQAALDLNADGIELDVQCCGDGTLVVMHDFTVVRTTNGSGSVRALPLPDIKALDAGSYFSEEFAGTQVPTLDEVLDLVNGRCVVNIEIKSIDHQGGVGVDLVARTIEDRNLYEQVIVSSFNPVSLIKLRHINPKVRRGLLYNEPLPDYLRDAWLSPLLEPNALHPHFHLVDDAFMVNARLLGKSVNTWTVNDVTEARRLAALGADVIITDVPDVIMAGLATNGSAAV